MNVLKLTLVGLLAATMFACSNDDGDAEATCTQADWLGTYIGSSNCNNVIENGEIVVTASGNNQLILTIKSTDNVGDETELGPLPFNGCNINFSEGPLNVTANLNGSKITITENVFGCTTTGTK